MSRNDDPLRKALEQLERAASEVSRYGAKTGPQWLLLNAALVRARVTLKAAAPKPAPAPADERAAMIEVVWKSFCLWNPNDGLLCHTIADALLATGWTQDQLGPDDYATDTKSPVVKVAYAIRKKKTGKLVTDGIGRDRLQLREVCDPDEEVVKVEIRVIEAKK